MKALRPVLALLALTVLASAAAQNIPAAFSGGNQPTVALVRQLCTGDFFSQWLNGAQNEAKSLGIKMVTYCANGDDAKMASDMQIAITQKVDAIIVDHGRDATMAPLVQRATGAGIKVVTFDLSTTDPAVVQIAQNEFSMGLQITMKMLSDLNGTGEMGLVYVGGFDPLDKRKAVFDAVRKFYPNVTLDGTWGTVSSNTVGEVESQTSAALLAHPNMKAILAPYDAFALGAMNAVSRQNKDVKVYGCDISTADIQAMIAAGSPWVATAATNPANIGSVAVRAAARLVAGETLPRYVLIEPTLVTRAFLVDNNVTNMADLSQKMPAFATTDELMTPWMSALKSQHM
ncbi:MAG: substrate-binding domain-containing protein [Deinococcales bacterium]